MNERSTQLAEFLRDYETDLLKVAKFFCWNEKGFELKDFDSHLLPDGFECPEDETYAELQNALDYKLDEMRQYGEEYDYDGEQADGTWR